MGSLKKAISSDTDEQPDVELLAAELDGKIVGSVAIFPSKSNVYDGFTNMLDYPEIRMLAVNEEYRGQGIAEALIKECIVRVKTKGYQHVGLHTADFMITAMRLYNRLGFVRIPKYDFQPADDGIIVKAFQLSIKD